MIGSIGLENTQEPTVNPLSSWVWIIPAFHHIHISGSVFILMEWIIWNVSFTRFLSLNILKLIKLLSTWKARSLHY